MNIYHRAYNPKMETIAGVVAEVDKLEQGWELSKVVTVSDYDCVAVFCMREPEPQRFGPAPKPRIRIVRLACPVVLACKQCPMGKHGACKDTIITGEEAVTK